MPNFLSLPCVIELVLVIYILWRLLVWHPQLRFRQLYTNMDYYKLMVPSQLTAERGSDVVVINPGSRNLRMGLASNESPLVVPHLIAWRTITEQSEIEISGPHSSEGAVVEGQFGKGTTNAAKTAEREECLRQIEAELGIQPLSKEDGRSWQKKLDSLETTSADPKDKKFTWTNVKVQEEKDTSSETMRKFICGEEALKIPSTKPYSLRRPICRGRFNASQSYSFQQVCDDICTIWEWALTNELGLHAKVREHLSAVLVVPDTLDSREIKELLTIILRDLQFSCAVIHQESVAVTFGTGASSGCVVNIGAQVTSVICVEEGVALPSTRVILPFGGEDISRCLHWLEQRLKSWPPVECDPLSNPLDLVLLDKVKETHCRVEDGDHRASVELQFHTFGSPSQTYRVILSELNVPPMGLFFPVLLAPEEYVPLPRPWHYTDSEEIILDDAIHVDTVRRPDTYEPGLSFGNHGPISEHFEHSLYGIVRQPRVKTEERIMGLSDAIVNSILLSGRIDIQKKLFSSIQLAGGSASIPGLIDAVEERVLQAIPVHESIDTVEVLPPRMETGIVAWKGGAIVAILDFTRDTWVQREDWIGGGLRVGSGRKYKDSFFLQTHTFWYTSS